MPRVLYSPLGERTMASMGDQAQTPERPSWPRFAEFFPFGPDNPEPTLTNSTFFHLGPPPEAPRPWHSALGVKRVRRGRKPRRSISGADVQLRCGFVASSQYDGPADDCPSAMAKAPSPQGPVADDATGFTPNQTSVTTLYVSLMAEF